MKRKIIEINENLCTGCAECIPNCYEGALQIIDGKARLIGDYLCDGLGACVGYCQTGAMEVIEKEAEPYDEKKVLEKMIPQGKNVLKAHLEHLRDHNANEYLNDAIEYMKEKGIENPIGPAKEKATARGCPGSMARQFNAQKTGKDISDSVEQESTLTQWPVQLLLLPTKAPFYENADLLISADCVPFAYANFHSKMLNGKTLAVGCPKLDDIEHYSEKLTEIFKQNNIKSINVAIMEVPCCIGLSGAARKALADSGKQIPLKLDVISMQGGIKHSVEY